MSQPRKATARGDPNSQVRNSNVRDHNLEPLTDHPKLCHRSRSKNRIPKSLRFDLENALVGLCDMWFEEIKPHLISNKIKVHIHDLPEAASGDHCRPSAPADAPGCSHLDPGSMASVCELCQLLFNAANSIESAVSQAASAISLPAGFVTNQ